VIDNEEDNRRGLR